jgi:hypothetical protein
MASTRNPYLIIGAALSALAALLHLGCIAFGAPWYRFLGAGEQLAQMALAGHWYPTFVALVIAVILSLWSLYALSGAGVVRKLPLVRLALCAITGVYILRGIAFAPLMPYFPGNSMAFWFFTSAISLAFGIIHLVGLHQVWARL